MGKISDAFEKSLKESKKKSDTDSVKNRGDRKDQNDSIESVLKKRLPRNEAGSFTENPKRVPVIRQKIVNKKSSFNLENIDKNLITLHNPQSVEAEQFRILKTKIMFPETGKPPKTIMTTSTFPGEGKSFTAANLAISIAQNIDEYVLLVDCDLRLPTIHSLFGYDNPPGLSNYLAGKSDLASLFLKTPVEKLTILPGGKPPDNPAELLSSGKMARLIEEVRERYDDRYIIIDTPPPQITSEASALAKQMDGIVLIVKYGASNREYVKELVDVLGKEKIIGVVFNQFNINETLGYGYKPYARYKSYYNYENDKEA